MLLRVFLFLFIFTVEVTVQAARVTLPTAKDPVQEPVHCLQTSDICAIKTPSASKFQLAVGAGDVVMDANSIVVRQSSHVVKLIQGTIWVKASEGMTVATAYGDVVSEGGEFWVRTEGDKVYVSSVASFLKLACVDKKTVLRLEEGEENWISGVGLKGQSTTGIPKAIALEEHLYRWARLYSGSKTQFETDVKNFHSRWSRQLASVADYHKQLAEARLKVLEEEAARRAQAKAQEEARSQELRALFRRKQFLD